MQTRPLLSDLTDRIDADIQASTGFTTPLLPQSVLRVLGKVFAGAIHLLYGFVIWCFQQIFPDTAESTYLDRWASIWGVSRNPATFAQYVVNITGVNGAIVTATDLSGISLISSASIEYNIILGTEIDITGDAQITIQSKTAGSSGNIITDTILTFVSPYAGVDSSATVATQGVNGVDAETDAALLSRLLARIQNPPQGGSAPDYVAWARSVSGVTRAWCYPDYGGPGLVGVTFVMDDTPGGPIPDSGTLAQVTSLINSKRPVTALPVIFVPSSVTINFDITMAGATVNIKTAVQTALAGLISDEGYPGQTILVNRIIQTIAENAGTLDFTLNAPTANQTMTVHQIAFMGTVTWH